VTQEGPGHLRPPFLLLGPAFRKLSRASWQSTYPTAEQYTRVLKSNTKGGYLYTPRGVNCSRHEVSRQGPQAAQGRLAHSNTGALPPADNQQRKPTPVRTDETAPTPVMINHKPAAVAVSGPS
jgi:hypothetical protein